MLVRRTICDSVCKEPDWPASEGAYDEGKKGKDDFREAKPK
jgi:hypothetical protein